MADLPAHAKGDPSRDCPLCPRLVVLRAETRSREPTWHNAPVPTFGSARAELLIVGLAPGLRGANRTGRPFTGDFAGDLLYATMLEFGFATGEYRARADDGLTLVNAAITNAVRCVPPQNKPTPAEVATCRPFLAGRIDTTPGLRALLALGRVAHESVLRAYATPLSRAPFGHGKRHELAPGGPTLFDSYHCSRYNTNTRVLTTDMFRAVFADIRAFLG